MPADMTTTQETFTFDRNSFLSYLLPEAVGHLSEHDRQAFFKAWEKAGSGVHTCTLVIDGVSLPVSPTMEAINAGMERHIAKKAEELIAERFASLSNTLYDLEQDAKSKIADAIAKIETNSRA